MVSCEDIHVVPLGQGQYWVGETVEFPNEVNQTAAEVASYACEFFGTRAWLASNRFRCQ